MAAGPLVLLSAQHPACDSTLLALLTPGPTARRLGFRTHPGPRIQSHLSSAAPDDCQQLAGPKAQLQSLSWGRGLGCSSSQGGHSSCNSFQAPRRPWDNQAGTRWEKLTPGQEKEPHGGTLFRPKEPATNVRGKHRPSASPTTSDGHWLLGGCGEQASTRPAAGPGPEAEPGPKESAAGAQKAAAGTGHPGQSSGVSLRQQNGGSAVAVGAAAQESGHHGCLYYPPSNSNFFPSLLANYPASVLISFYYWN